MTQLRHLSDCQLLQLTQYILAQPRNMTRADRKELLAINDEFVRRDALRAQNMCANCHQPMNGGPRCTNCGGL